MDKSSYSEIKLSLQRENRRAERIFKLNEILKDYEWYFVHPYVWESQISLLLNKHESGTLTKDFLDDFFIMDFYNLDSTICFIDGFFQRSEYLKPFCYNIENSLILSFQRDYAGAINVLIPAIEGILTKWLNSEGFLKVSMKDRYSKIRTALEHIKKKIIFKIEEGYNEQKKENNEKYNPQQEKYVLELEGEYFNNWFNGASVFLSECLFAPSNSVDASQKINRHDVLHSLSLTPYDNIQNYIKLFNCLRFLCWVFLQLEQSTSFNEIDNETFLRKRILYEDIIKHSQKISFDKHLLLKEYKAYDSGAFYKDFSVRPLFSDENSKLKFAVQIKRWQIEIEKKLLKAVKKEATKKHRED